MRVSRGYQDSRALYVFAKLGLAERFLDNTEKTVAKIIQEVVSGRIQRFVLLVSRLAFFFLDRGSVLFFSLLG